MAIDFHALLGIAAIVVMLALAGDSIFNHRPLDKEWGLLLAAIFGMLTGLRKVQQKRQDREDNDTEGGAE